ncbi:hypothetical protein AB0C40_32115 [Streptomyces brevispora]|uniref:hypothetical protein n=1 Tax=Streptomyces brevispora TaxID=887462 RepID=UPI003400D157
MYSFPEYCLSRLLPAAPVPGSGDEPAGIPGLRIGGINAGDRQLLLYMAQDFGQAAAVVLTLPLGLSESWEEVERRHRHWCEGNGRRPLWTTSKLDPVESAYIHAFPSLERSRSRRAAVGSALLRVGDG